LRRLALAISDYPELVIMILIIVRLPPQGDSMKNALSLALPATLLALALAACGSDEDASGGGTKITATTGILSDITSQVAGPDAEVEQLIPEGSSPHDFQLSAQDRAGVEDSALLVANGEGLEAGVPLDEIDVERFELAESAPGLLFEEPGEHEREEGHEGEDAAEHGGDAEAEEEPEHGTVDPHVWMDPARVAAALPALAEALSAADPGHAEGYRSRAERYAEELTALDRELEGELAQIPPDSRELVTSHDALGYFADRYDFTVVATPFPASGAEAEASAGRIAEVEEAIRATGVPTVFAEAEDDPEVLELIADETGVRVEPGLLVESPGPAGGYVEMLREDGAMIAAGLTPGGAQE
jgi:zinc/manganese transport system substrate-binding protein